MNILHISQTNIECDSRILKEMQSLTKHYSTAKIYSLGVKSSDCSNTSKPIPDIVFDTIEIKSTKLKYLPKVLIHIFSVIEIMAKMFFKALKIKPDIIHCHDTPALPLGILLKFITSSKIIYDAHELESDRNGLSKLSGRLTLIVERIVWRFIDALIVVSPSIEKWYLKKIGLKYSTVILNSPLLVAKKISKHKSPNLRKTFSIPSESRIFLYVGAFVPGRGINLLISVFKRKEIDSHLVFLGQGTMGDRLKTLAETHNNIHVHDPVAHEEVISIAKSADVGLCFIQKISLSDYYCLPNKLFEYCFSEIPILASDFPDISEVVRKYKLGKCSALDTQSIYDSIKEFENTCDLPKIQVNNLYDLSWNAQEKKLIELYNHLINN